MQLLAQIRNATANPTTAYRTPAGKVARITSISVANVRAVGSPIVSIFHDDDGASYDEKTAILFTQQVDGTLESTTSRIVNQGGTIGFQADVADAVTISIYGVEADRSADPFAGAIFGTGGWSDSLGGGGGAPGAATLSAVLASGNTTGGTGISVTSGDAVIFANNQASAGIAFSKAAAGVERLYLDSSDVWRLTSDLALASGDTLWLDGGPGGGGGTVGLSSPGAGLVTSTGTLRLPDGTTSVPAVAFTSDPDTGFYRVGSDEFAAVAGTVEAALFNASGIEIPDDLGVRWGSGATFGRIYYVSSFSQLRVDIPGSADAIRMGAGNVQILRPTFWNTDRFIGIGNNLYSGFIWASAQTNDALMFGVADPGTGESSRTVIICDKTDTNFNFQHAVQSDPTFFLHSEAQSTVEYAHWSWDSFSLGTGFGGRYEWRTFEEEVTVAVGLSSAATSGSIPANSWVHGVSIRVTQATSTSTTIDVGRTGGGDPDEFINNADPQTLGDTATFSNDGTVQAPVAVGAADTLTVTLDLAAASTDLKVRVTAFYLTEIAPTS